MKNLVNYFLIILFFTYLGSQNIIIESLENSLSEAELILELMKTIKNTTGKYSDFKKNIKELTNIKDSVKNKIDFKMFSDFTIKLYNGKLTKEYINEKIY